MSSEVRWEIPFHRNLVFVGHEALLASIPERLTQAPLVLAGIGGIGKSALALEYASRAQDRYRALIWLDASSAISVNAQFAQMSRSTPALFNDLWGDASKTLLILDNVFDVDVIRGLLPQNWAGHLLLTIRFLPSASPIPVMLLPPLSQEEGAQLLLRRARVISVQGPLREATTKQQTDALAIADEMGGFPLALEQAGAYLEAIRGHPGTYRPLYEKWPVKMLSNRGTLPGPLHPASVAMVVESLVQSLLPAHLEVLRLLAFLPQDGSVSPPSGEHEALEELRLRFLIQAGEQDATRVCMHRVVQMLIRESIPAKQRAEYVTQAAVLKEEGRSGNASGNHG